MLFNDALNREVLVTDKWIRMEHCVYESGTGKLKYLNEPCSSDNLSTTTPHGLSWGWTQAFKVTNSLSHGTAISNDVQWLVTENYHLYYLQSITVTRILCFCSSSWRCEVSCSMLQDTVEMYQWQWPVFNILSSTCLERLTKILEGSFQFFYSTLIMPPLKNRWKKQQINKIVPKQGDVLEFPVGSLVWGRLAGSPWWPGMYKCVCEFLCYLYHVFSYIPYFNKKKCTN